MFMKISRLLLFFWFCILICGGANGQTIVGMGTDNPNPNAVLELVSANQNQGFLVPRLSTQQRNASSFTSKLTDQDNGLMIFDTDEGSFYYWYNGAWRSGTGDLTAKGTVWYAGNTTPDNSQGKDEDFYVHQSTGDVYRKQDGVFLILGSLAKNENQYAAGTGISITNQNEIVNTGDLDVTNELQNLSLSGTTLGLSGSITTVDLGVLQDGTGTDSQNLSNSRTGNDISISIDNGNTTTFSVADTDSNTTNEVITSASLTAGDTLRIQEAGAIHDVDLSRFQKKALPTGQVLVGNTSGVASPVSISGDITLNSDGTMTIKLDAITTAKIINNAITTAKIADDAVTKNKINADVAGNGLAQNTDGSLEVNVAGGGLQLTTDQLQLANKGDGEVLIGDGTQINSKVISGDMSLANTGAATVAGLQGNPVGTTTPANNEVLTWDGSEWVPQLPPYTSGTWYSGNTVPDDASPSGTVDGNYYYHTETQTVYRKESGVWVELGKWVKLRETTTVQGATITSTTVPTLYIGSGQPINGTIDNAQPGDLYFNTSEGSDGRVYIKKNNKDWQGL